MKGVTDGTTAMNGISGMKWNDKQRRSNASGCGKENEMTTSTFGIKNITSTVFHNVPVVTPKDIINPPTPLFATFKAL